MIGIGVGRMTMCLVAMSVGLALLSLLAIYRR